MRYWLLTTEFPPFYGGGISTYCDITVKMLQQNGHEVTVFLQDFSVTGMEESFSGGTRIVRFHPRLTDAHHFLGYTAYLSYEFAEAVKTYILKEGKPDVIEAHEYQGIAYYIQQFKWQGIEPFANLKIVVTCHSPSFICLDYNQAPVYQFPNYWTGEMEKATIKSADLVIFPGNYVKQEIEKRMSLNGVRYAVVPNPMESLDLSKTIEKPIDPNLVVCFGKLAPLKGTFELLKYFARLWDEGSLLKLYIIGGTDYFFYPESRTMQDIIMAKYKRFVDDKKLVLKGNLPAAQHMPYLCSAKLVVVPSLFDNFPYTVLEALSIGKVVLASRQGGQSEMIDHEKNGFLFDHYTEGDFQQQLQKVCVLSQEEQLQVQTNSKCTVLEKYHPDVIYPQKIKVIEDLLRADTTADHYPFITDIQMQHGDLKELSAGTDGQLLSIVIPYYNMGNYIEDTLQSVFACDYQHKEVLVINDGSTEQKSIEKLAEIKANYPVQVISRSNSGLSATRNYGAAIAKGAYIAFLDADDTVEPSYYSTSIAILNKYHNVHFVGCWLNYFGEGKGTWPTFNPEPPYILIHNTINSSAIVFKRHTFTNYGNNSTDMIYGMEDWEAVIKLVSQGYRGVVIPQKLFNYRVRKGSMSQSFTREKQLYLTKLIAQKHKTFYAAYGAEVAQLLNSNGSSLYFDNPTFEVVQAMPNKRMSSIKNALKEYIKRSKTLRKTAYFIYKKIKR
jgi:glycosyltransferase involved in cell wall biosynthesis